MEKFSYNNNNSYPESTDSSPRSREIDFDNPPPWDDQNHHYKVKFMCSYGGKIQPRPHDNQLTYVNGETKILSVDRSIRFPILASKLAAVCGGDGPGDVLFKYQLPGEDLDALISVTNDDDLEHMMHEYDRLLRMSSKPARMRLFLFPAVSPGGGGGGFGSEGSTHSDRDRFVEALNTVRSSRPESEKSSVTAPPPQPNNNNADFLFGSDKTAAPPTQPQPLDVKLPVAVGIEPPPFINDPRLIQPDHAEIQRQMQLMQIRDQEQHQERLLLQQQQHEASAAASYRRKSEEGLIENGGYFPPQYGQNQPQSIPQSNPQASFWQNNRGGAFPASSTPGIGLHEQPQPPQQPVYMIPSPTPTPHPGPVYHQQPPPQQQQQGGVMRPIATGGYYPPVQRMAPETYREPPYNVAQPPVGAKIQQQQQPPPFASGPPPPQYAAARQQVVGVPETTSYTHQVAYPGGMGKQVYYTEASQPPVPQYQGVGVPVSGVTGPDGKVIAMNMAPPPPQAKVSSQNSDSAM